MLIRVELPQEGRRSIQFREVRSMPKVGDIIKVDDYGDRARVVEILERKQPPLVRAEVVDE